MNTKQRQALEALRDLFDDGVVSEIGYSDGQMYVWIGEVKFDICNDIYFDRDAITDLLEQDNEK